MSTYGFEERYRWSDEEIRDRVYLAATDRLGAVDIKRETDAREDKKGTDFWAFFPQGPDGKPIRPPVSIDAKKRSADWPDVLLEIISVVETGALGWAVDPSKRTDYLLELWPSRSLLVSYPQVRAATIAHRTEWEGLYLPHDKNGKPRDSASTRNGRRWHTRNLHVPEVVLLDALYPELRAISLIPPKDVWRVVPQRCFTCGGEPIGRFNDGSPRYGCSHPAVALVPLTTQP